MYDNVSFWQHTACGVTVVGCSVTLPGMVIHYTINQMLCVEV